MMSGVASKLRKLSNKSPSKNRALASSDDNGGGRKGADKASKDMEETFPSSKSQKTAAKKSLASVRGSTKDKRKHPKTMEAEGERAEAEETNDSGKEGIPNYYLEPPEVLESMFQHFVVEKIKPPVEVLHIQSIIGLPYAGRVNRKLKFPSPYRLRNPKQNKRVCFPREDEVGVYCDFFSYGFRFPLDKDVEALLKRYRLSLCQYSPTAIRAIMAFISLTRNAQVPFSVDVFRHFYQLRISPGDSWAMIVA